MPRVRTALIVAVMTALLTPASAAAVDRDNRCLKYADRYTTVEMTKFGVIFWKPVGDATPRYRMHYGCIFSVERARRLRGQSTIGDRPVTSVRTVTLNGRFAAYGLDRHDEFAGRLLIYDLKRADLVLNARANDPTVEGQGTHGDVVVMSVVGNASGATAWISHDADFETPVREVSVWRGEQEGRTMLDRGTEIQAESLAKSRDELTVYWQNGASPRSAPLE